MFGCCFLKLFKVAYQIKWVALFFLEIEILYLKKTKMNFKYNFKDRFCYEWSIKTFFFKKKEKQFIYIFLNLITNKFVSVHV